MIHKRIGDSFPMVGSMARSPRPGQSAGGEEPAATVYYNAFRDGSGSNTNMSNMPGWTLITGTGSNLLKLAHGDMYAQNIGTNALIIWDDPPVPFLTNDVWIRCELRDTWAIAGDYMAIAVRAGTVVGTNNCYHLQFNDSGVALVRTDNGVNTVLASGTVLPASGQVYELQVAGSVLTAYRDDVQIFQENDATYSTGAVGIAGDGLDPDGEVSWIHCGDLPKGNAAKFNNTWGNMIDKRNMRATCATTFDDDYADASTGIQSAHNAVVHDIGGTAPGHYFELDMEIPLQILGVRGWDADVNTPVQWNEFALYGSGDGTAWTLVEDGLSMSGTVSGWREAALAAASDPYRYWRFEVYDTDHASNFAGTYELQLTGRVVT